MIIEQHYDEEVLAEFLAEPGDAVARDKHLAGCDLCLKTLHSLRASAQILREPAVWNAAPISTAPRPDTLAFLRGVQKTMAEENNTAAVWIKQLLAGPRETWASRLAEHPEWRTGGMVRALLKAGDAVINVLPADAVDITRIAVEIAEGLTAEQPLSNALRHLRGLAYFDHAYALWDTGFIAEAVEVLDRAEEAWEGLGAVEFDRGRAQVIRAMAYHVLERREEALQVANSAATIFAEYQDPDRVAASRTAAASTLQSVQRFREALAIHAELAESADISDMRRVTALHNRALCHHELGEFDSAASYLVQAIAGYERLGMITARTKSRWALAQLFMKQSKHEQAVKLLQELRQEFEDVGMTNDVAMASLDISESLLSLGRIAEISDVCRAAMAYFAAAGLSQTEPALRGLAFIQEAAIQGRVSADVIRGVRAFIQMPSSEPNLLFARLPEHIF